MERQSAGRDFLFSDRFFIVNFLVAKHHHSS
jgi:hypothetical protein